jgi:mono/diheme cytochrome c family protein
MTRFAIAAAAAGAILATAAISRAQDNKQAAAATEPPPSRQMFEDGQQVYRDRCSRCHGWDMVNLGSYSFDLRKFPKDDRKLFFNSVLNGKNSMPAWKGVLTDREIEQVWAYVRTGGHL